VNMAHMHRNVSEAELIKRDKAEQWLHEANDAEKVGPALDSQHPYVFDKDFPSRTKNRKELPNILIGSRSRAEQEIERKLSGQANVSFKEKPLKDVLTELKIVHGVNIVPDKAALTEDLVNLDMPISIELDNIPLKSALNLILRDAK